MVKRICEICQKEFLGSVNTKTCSAKCFVIRDQKQKQIRKQKKKPKPKVLCVWCHEEFSQVQPNHVYCSLECGNEFRRMIERIYKAFDGEKEQIELERLREEGKFYVEKSKIVC